MATAERIGGLSECSPSTNICVSLNLIKTYKPEYFHIAHISGIKTHKKLLS
jgi:hypothetical protein